MENKDIKILEEINKTLKEINARQETSELFSESDELLNDNVGKIVPLRRMKQYCCVGVNRTATSE